MGTRKNFLEFVEQRRIQRLLTLSFPKARISIVNSVVALDVVLTELAEAHAKVLCFRPQLFVRLIVSDWRLKVHFIFKLR